MYLTEEQLFFLFKELELSMDKYSDMVNDYHYKRVIQDVALDKSKLCDILREKIKEEARKKGYELI